ncbi:MAG: signal peptidase I [Ruminococcaceae bacterium]|nr:signal peptidase I [Oscillospiraceae bacterium]
MNKSATTSKKAKLITRIIVLALIGGFLGYQIYLVNSEKLIGDSMPMPFGVGASVVLSGSMEPELSVDDLIIVKSQENYSINDVVVFQSHGSLVVHRIISIEEGMVTTKGDANNTSDEPIKIEEIKGIVVKSIPYVGGFVSFLKSPIGIILTVGIAVFLMEFSFRREKKQNLDELEAIKEEIRKLKENQ